MVFFVVLLFSLCASGLSNTNFRSLLDNSAVVEDAALEWKQLEQVLAEESRPAFATKKRRPAYNPRGLVPDSQRTFRQGSKGTGTGSDLESQVTPEPLPEPEFK